MQEPQKTLNAQRSTLNVEVTEITAGKYTLRPFHEGSLWLENEEGEGMQIFEKDFQQVLDDYWRKYF